MGVKIVGLGKAVPTRCLSNDELAARVDTSHEWIQTRTGIESRHVVTTETLSMLGAEAARQALDEAHIAANALDVIIVATVSGNTAMPSTACLVAQAIGANTARCFDLAAACSGFIFATEVAMSLLQQRHYQSILVIGAEILSTRLNWQDRNTCVLFGDGAGAVLYQRSEDKNQILAIETGTDAGGAELITLPIHIKQTPYYEGEIKPPIIQMDGRKVYAFSTTKVPESIRHVVSQTEVKMDEIDCFILHQANSRIMDSVAQKLGVERGRFFKNIAAYGNTSAASIPMALYDAREKFESGYKIILSGFGAGLTWGTMLLEW